MQQVRRFATEVNPKIQMLLPLAKIVGMPGKASRNLIRQAGLWLMAGIMEEDLE